MFLVFESQIVREYLSKIYVQNSSHMNPRWGFRITARPWSDSMLPCHPLVSEYRFDNYRTLHGRHADSLMQAIYASATETSQDWTRDFLSCFPKAFIGSRHLADLPCRWYCKRLDDMVPWNHFASVLHEPPQRSAKCDQSNSKMFVDADFYSKVFRRHLPFKAVHTRRAQGVHHTKTNIY